MSERVIPAARFQAKVDFRDTVAPLPTGWVSPKRAGRVGAQQELDRIRREAHEKGHAEGFQEGFAEGRAIGLHRGLEEGRDRVWQDEEAGLAQFRVELAEVVEEVLASVERWYVYAESELAALAVEIAERVVAAELETNDQVIVNITKQALEEVGAAREARIRVNPFDSGRLAKQKERLLALNPSLRSIEIVDDPAVSNGCVVESDGGTVRNVIREKLATIVDSVERAA